MTRFDTSTYDKVLQVLTEMEWGAMNGDCPDTGKRRYATARAAHGALRQAYWGKRSKEQPRRVYYCKRCQGYHLTSHGDIWGRRRRLSVCRKREDSGDQA